MKARITLVAFLTLFPVWVSAEKTLDGDNLTYLGAIRLPANIYPNDIAYHPGGDPAGGGDGFPGSFYVLSAVETLDRAVEVSIPAPQISTNPGNLPQAQILRGPQTITCNKEPEHDRFGGIAYLPAQGAVSEKLYWNIHEYYNVDGRDHDPGGWVNPDFSGCAGTWHYGPRDGGTYHSMKIEQFMFRIWDTDWADSVLGGRYLISGKTREAGCCGSGQGINLYGVAPYLSGNPPADGSTVSAQVLMHYGTAGSPSGDIEMPGVNGDPPYVATDRFLGGAWVRVGAEDAIVIIGRKSLGPERYGVGGSGDCNNHQGYHGDPYEPRFWFIDPTDLEPVIAGTVDPWDVAPYTTYNPSGETYNDHCNYDYETYGGADFDYSNSLLYVVEPNLYSPSRLDVLHVYRVLSDSNNDYTLAVGKNGTGTGTVTSSPSGIHCGVDCQEIYNHGTTVQLTASPDSNSYFAGWSGHSDCSDSTVTMTGGRDCTASFELGTPPTYTLRVSLSGTGSGIVTSSPTGIDCGFDCQESYPEGTILQLAATPGSDSYFSGWSGDSDCSDSFVTLVSDTACTAAFTESTAEQGQVAIYKFDEGSGPIATDSSGNNHHGTLINGPAWASGAIAFDGSDDYVELGTFDVEGTALTLAAWFTSDNFANCSHSDCRLISKATSTAEDAHYFMLSTVREGASTRLRFRLQTGGVTKTLVASSGNLASGEWVHAAAVFDGSEMRLYQDGQLVGSTAKSGYISTDDSVPVWIGGNPDGPTSMPWDGTIDEVRIYDRALTVSEIRTLPPPGKGQIFGSGFESGDLSAWSASDP